MFIVPRLSAHASKSAFCSALTQAFSIKSDNNIKFQNSRSSSDKSEDYSTSPLLGVSGAVIAAVLLYFKRNEIRKFIIDRESLPIASCLEEGIEVKQEKDQIPQNSGITRRLGIIPPRKRAKLSKELKIALERTDQKLLVFKEKHGIPGISAAVSVDGRIIWSKGYGYSDLENLVPCTPNTVMRIASISKPLTASAIALLWQRGKVDLDLPIQTYVPEFPIKNFEGKAVKITTRQVMTHMSGIRNYLQADNIDKKNSKHQVFKMMEAEWHNKSKFSNLSSSLNLFKDDPLIHAPGTHYLYSTHAWTLISAVIEAAGNQRFLPFMLSHVFAPYELSSTQADTNAHILPHRSRHYERRHNKLRNTPYVDNSYKWAGGGLLSSVLDVSRFGNTMLGFYQGVYGDPSNQTDSYVLSRQIVKQMWTCQTPQNEKGYCLGLGWFVNPQVDTLQRGSERFSVFHSGAAVGASSHLLVLPRGEESVSLCGEKRQNGVVVAIIGNLEGISFHSLISEVGDNIYSAAYN